MAKVLEWEKISMALISKAGEAKSTAMLALYDAKDGKFAAAEQKIKAATSLIGEASHEHFEVIQEEAKGEQLDFKVLFMHAEDQLLTTQMLITIVEEMIEMYKRFGK